MAKKGATVADSRRSPLKQRPLHNPGESVQRQLDELLDTELIAIVFPPVLLFAFAGYEWLAAWLRVPRQPVLALVFAIVSLVYSAFRWRGLRARTDALKQGRDGEKAVAQYLELHRDVQWRILNDIPAPGFNVDHVLIAPQGVFVLETKTFSKRGDNPKATYDGKVLKVNGYVPDRDPVAQVSAIRDWVRGAIEETTGRKVRPRGVVLMPDWWIDPPPAGVRPDVWVLNPKALPTFIGNEPTTLTIEDVALIADSLGHRSRRE